ncbi:MAG: DNA/RNA non-specific endonuclease [Clostridia bacterium]|nr:DNA/RNA non-specific endonuclease [Clostridia bacterium]
MTKRSLSVLFAVILIFSFGGCNIGINNSELTTESTTSSADKPAETLSLKNLPQYSGKAYQIINGNEPYFTDEQKSSAEPFENYSKLDSLKRCGVAFACLGKETMPTEKRGSISEVKPSGWKVYQYDFVDGGSLYNRCHLIGFKLSAENANARNLITGTRYFNTNGMLLFENMTEDYIKETDNHVLYRVTPIFVGTELVARGVQMEAYSVEDEGDGVCFNVYCFNVQPGVEINYQTGESKLAKEKSTTAKAQNEKTSEYVLNTSSHKFHRPDCPSVGTISANNKSTFKGKRQELINKGYKPCSACSP